MEAGRRTWERPGLRQRERPGDLRGVLRGLEPAGESSGPRRRQGLATAGARGRGSRARAGHPCSSPIGPRGNPLVSRREVSKKILAMSPRGRGQQQGSEASLHRTRGRVPRSQPSLWGRGPLGGLRALSMGKSRQKPSTWAGVCVGLARTQLPASVTGAQAPRAQKLDPGLFQSSFK